MQNWRKIIFLICGIVILIAAYIGILLPGIPAIPFILLSAWFFLQSSDKLFSWMLRRKIIGSVMQKYFLSGNVSKKMKWFVISQFWVSLIVAQIIFHQTYITLFLINVTGIAGSILIYKLIK